MKFRRGIAAVGVVWLVIGVSLLVPSTVRATIVEINPLSTYTLTHHLQAGDVISWDWHTTNPSEGLDFWIEDISGTRYSSRDSVHSWEGSFPVPEAGTWYVRWHNDNWFTPVTVEYDVGINVASGALNWLWIIIIIIVVIAVILAVVAAANAARKRQQPYQQQPPPYQQQPPYEQQPPYQQQYPPQPPQEPPEQKPPGY